MELYSFKAGGFIPALQAVLTGVLFGVLTASVVLMAGAAEQLWLFVLFGGSSMGFIMWVFGLRHWVQLVNHMVGFIEQPMVQVLEPEPYTPSKVRVELVENQNGSWQGAFLDLPCEPEQLKLLASGVAAGGTLAESAWCGANRPFSKSQFHAVRQALIERGWLQWRNHDAPAQGIEPTHAGKRVFSYLAEIETHSPTITRRSW